MITPKQYFIDLCYKTVVDAKTGGLMGQDLSVYIRLNVGRIDM